MKLIRKNRPHFSGFPLFFDDALTRELCDLPKTSSQSILPAVNIQESSESFSIELAVPGLKKEDFVLKLEKNVLHISTGKSEKASEENSKYTRKEFSYKAFKRSFKLPDSVDYSKIDASYENGILLIALPKKEEAKDKNLEIKVS